MWKIHYPCYWSQWYFRCRMWGCELKLKQGWKRQMSRTKTFPEGGQMLDACYSTSGLWGWRNQNTPPHVSLWKIHRYQYYQWYFLLVTIIMLTKKQEMPFLFQPNISYRSTIKTVKKFFTLSMQITLVYYAKWTKKTILKTY